MVHPQFADRELMELTELCCNRFSFPTMGKNCSYYITEYKPLSSFCMYIVMWHCTPCTSTTSNPGRPSRIFILFLYASLKAKGLKLILGRNRLRSGYRTALSLLIFVGAFIKLAGHELLACWLFSSDLCLFLSCFRGYVPPNKTAIWIRMVREGKETFLACY